MPTDSEILDELEKEIGWKLPRVPLGSRLPWLTSSLFRREKRKELALPEETADFQAPQDDLTPQDAVSGTTFGAILDDEGNVRALALTGLSLKRVPSPVWRLNHLEALGLFANGLEEIPSELRDRPGILGVQLGVNQIETVPPWVLDSGFAISLDYGPLPEGRVLWLGQNPLRSPPPEIITKGVDAMRAYYASLEGDTLPLSEVKILLVGDGGCGKTSLVNILLGRPFDAHESQTHGINIDPWHIKTGKREIRLNLWDFGGQEIMHATHLFFLSQRSLYVLVLDGRKEEDAEYWLKHIESFGGDSPVLVVLNKMDENPGFDVNRRFLQQKYKGIVDFYPISCSTGAGLKRFVDGIKKGLNEVRIIQTTWPRSWFEVKTCLEKLTSHFISFEEYEAICRKNGLDTADKQNALVQFLNDLGSVVHFPDFGLRHMHVLQPRWLTGAVYRIVNAPVLAEQKGILKLSCLPQILNGRQDEFCYPSETHPYIVDLMKKFEICYSIDPETVLVPDLLEVQEPEIKFDYDKALRFRLDYDFLPRAVIPRFIVKKHKDISGQLRWRTGVVLADKSFDTTAVVKADDAAKRIYIYIGGNQRRDYLTVVRAAFLEINQSFEKLQVQEKVCLPDAPDVTVSFDHLIRLEKEGVVEVYPDGATHPYRVADLLGSVTLAAKLNEEDFVRILEKVLAESDTKETALAKANRIFTLQPNVAGFGVNLNALIDKILRKKKR